MLWRAAVVQQKLDNVVARVRRHVARWLLAILIVHIRWGDGSAALATVRLRELGSLGMMHTHTAQTQHRRSTETQSVRRRAAAKQKNACACFARTGPSWMNASTNRSSGRKKLEGNRYHSFPTQITAGGAFGGSAARLLESSP
jgi:hypothetical protein